MLFLDKHLGGNYMHNELINLLSDIEYEEVDELELYEDYIPHKMTKREFVREMLRLQEEKSLYAE